MILPIAATATLLLACILLAWLCWKKATGRHLRSFSLQRVQKAWQHAVRIQDPILRIIEADKVLSLALREVGFTGSLGEQLQHAGPRLPDLNSVWDAHKLRNRLAHETQATPSPNEVQRAMRAFEQALRSLGM